MPTISQLPAASSISASDEVPISQAGVARAASVGELLASVQPVITVSSASLLGRTSLGSGGPEQVDVGMGLSLSNGTLTANGLDLADFPAMSNLAVDSDLIVSNQGSPMLMQAALLRGLFAAGANVAIDANGTISASPGNLAGRSTVTSMTGTDFVEISQAGADSKITLANLLNGETIDSGTIAAAASDTDTFWVGQGSSTMTVQGFAALWTYIAGKLPYYHRAVAQLTANTTLDGTIHNGAILVCSQPVTIIPSFVIMGSGFSCTVINLSSGNVTFASGIITSSGMQALYAGQAAELRAFTYSGGNVVFAQIGGGLAPVVTPGQVGSLATGITTPTSVALSWGAPATGGVVTTYTVNYRMTSVAGSWSSQSASGTSLTVSGLASATGYDFEVVANNSAGSGAASPIATATTLAAPSVAPGQVIGLTTSGPTTRTVDLTWTAPSSGGAVATYTAQYRVTGGSGWTTAATGITSLAYTVTDLTAGTGYDFQVFAVNAAGNGTASSVATASTTTAAPGLPTALTAGSPTGTTMPLTWTAPSTGGAVATYSVRSSPHGTNTWTQVDGITSAVTTITGLIAAGSYDFEVEAVNAGGNSGWTAVTTASTAGGGGTGPFNAAGYLMTMGTRTASGPFTAGATDLAATANDNSTLGDGSHATPATVVVGWSLSNTAAPTTGLAAMTNRPYGDIFSLDGHNQWAAWIAGPTTPGSYYMWFIASDGAATIVSAFVSSSPYQVTGAVVAPDEPTGLAAGTATATAMPLTWTAPATGGAVETYSVRSSPAGTGTWTTVTGISGTSTTISGLTAGSSYDFEVQAVNTAGSSSWTSLITASTAAVVSHAPNLPTTLAAGTATATTMPLTWRTPATDGSHDAAATYSMRFSPAGAGTWTQVDAISAIATTVGSLTAFTSYDFEVEAVNAAGNSGWTTATTASTAASGGGNYALGSGFQPYALGTTQVHSATLAANVCTMIDAADGSHTVPTAVYFGWNTSPTAPPISTAGMTLSDGTFAQDVHTYAYAWSVPAPSVPGTYYFWAVATDPNGAIVASCAQGATILLNEAGIPFTIT